MGERAGSTSLEKFAEAHNFGGKVRVLTMGLPDSMKGSVMMPSGPLDIAALREELKGSMLPHIKQAQRRTQARSLPSLYPRRSDDDIENEPPTGESPWRGREHLDKVPLWMSPPPRPSPRAVPAF